ncbi:MAG TPA: formate dehydrogenase [Chloroflexi bacterium]|nr:formate dehydrogenase [Chloroflexota bacterium]
MRTFPVENNDVLAAVRGFLRRLLESHEVDMLLLPIETASGAITPALIADPNRLSMAHPLAPVLGLNAATVAGNVSVREPRGRIGVMLRPCELRALVELVKLQQASLDDLVTIGVDCFGTYDVPTYRAKAQKKRGRKKDTDAGSGLWRELYERMTADPQTRATDLRDACQMCERPHVEQADVTLALFGADLSAAIPVSLPDEMAQRLGLEPAEENADGERASAIQAVTSARINARDARFGEMRARLEQEGIEDVLAACVRCHNCMTVCPICYCKTCLFNSAFYDHEPVQYLNWSRRKGAYRMPSDTTLFHLTRLNHMALSCVGCGMCTDGCPADLPVGLVFRTIGQQVQRTFEYEPGRSVEEPLPLITFQESEWTDVGVS